MSNPAIRLRVAECSEQCIVLEAVADEWQPGASGSLRFPIVNGEFSRSWAVGDVIEWQLLRRSRDGVTVQRNNDGGSSMDGAFVRDSVRVLSAAHALNGDMDRTLSWYREFELPYFGGRTAESLVREGQVQQVLDYIATLK